MLLSSTVPHHVNLLSSYSIVVVKELQKKVTFLDYLGVETFSEHHIEDPVIVHPLD